MRRFKCVAVGGTFDHLHEGHKALLRKACEVGDRVIIGVATEALLASKIRKERIHPYEKRVKDVKDFLASEGCLSRALIVPISTQSGTTAEDPEIEAVVVSEETAPAIENINRTRVERRLKPLEKIVIKMVLGEDGLPIRSTTLRQIES